MIKKRIMLLTTCLTLLLSTTVYASENEEITDIENSFSVQTENEQEIETETEINISLGASNGNVANTALIGNVTTEYLDGWLNTFSTQNMFLFCLISLLIGVIIGCIGGLVIYMGLNRNE